MRLDKTIFIMCAAMICVFIITQSSYTHASMMNLAPKADGEDVRAKVKAEVDAAKKPLASGETITADIIQKINATKDAVIQLNGQPIQSAVSNVTNPKAYAIGLGSVRLAMVGVEGKTYNFVDSTVSPLLFSEKYATGQTQGFADAVTNLKSDEIAVIIAITMSSDDIKKAIEGKVNLDKVVIVEATTAESKIAFGDLFKQHNEGFSLGALDRNSAVVVKALQGAV